MQDPIYTSVFSYAQTKEKSVFHGPVFHGPVSFDPVNMSGQKK